MALGTRAGREANPYRSGQLEPQVERSPSPRAYCVPWHYCHYHQQPMRGQYQSVVTNQNPHDSDNSDT